MPESLIDALRRIPSPPTLLVPDDDVEAARDAVAALPSDVIHPEVQASPHPRAAHWWLYQPLATSDPLAVLIAIGDTTP